MLSPIREQAAKALVVHLGYQPALAESDVFSMPDYAVDEIIAATSEPSQIAESIRGVLSRLYDRRRDGHQRSATEEMDTQRRIVAARVVLENQLGMSVEDSVARTKRMTAEELDIIADVPLDDHCAANLTQFLVHVATRLEAEDDAALAAAAAAEAAVAVVAAVDVQNPESAVVSVVSSEPTAAPAAAEPEVVDAEVIEPAADPAPATPAVDPPAADPVAEAPAAAPADPAPAADPQV